MSSEKLSENEYKLLLLIVQYIKEFNELPPRGRNCNSWFVETGELGSNHITQLKRRLKEEAYIDNRLALTAKGRRYLETTEQATKEGRGLGALKVRIGVRGTVFAGPLDKNKDGVYTEENLEEFDSPPDDMLLIPDTSNLDREVFALKVKGRSMENEEIFEGDYLIVERFPPWPVIPKPNNQDMIVTLYIPEDNPFLGSEDGQISPDEYVGPTVKIYKLLENGKIELGWRKDNRGNEWAIHPADIRPIGRVIGVYKKIPRDI